MGLDLMHDGCLGAEIRFLELRAWSHFHLILPLHDVWSTCLHCPVCMGCMSSLPRLYGVHIFTVPSVWGSCLHCLVCMGCLSSLSLLYMVPVFTAPSVWGVCLHCPI